MGNSVGIHPPKTPVTKGSHGIAKNTLPNVCKMPGPPAPFVPSPLPNIGKSELSPKGYSNTVEIEGQLVAIRGASFESMGDMASKGTGGGLISANTHGLTKFITPGSMTVKIEGKNVHLLGEPMLNNCGPGGSPPNTGAAMTGVDQSKAKKPPCPAHDLEWEALTPEGEQERQDRAADEVKKRNQRIRQNEYGLKRAKEFGEYDKAREARRLLNINKGQQADDEFAARVAQEAKAVWTSIKYRCKNCDFSGDIDVFTQKGIIKECKNNGKAERKQIEKYQIAGPVIFGAAFKGIHMAVPGVSFSNTQQSLSDQGISSQECGIQAH